MIVLIDVSLSHLFCLPPPPSFCVAISVSTFLLTLIHCMSSQNIEREWISLTCTWLVVSGRVQIRLHKCETLVDIVLNNKKFSLSYSQIPLLARKHHLETFESRTARALAHYVLLLLVSMLI